MRTRIVFGVLWSSTYLLTVNAFHLQRKLLRITKGTQCSARHHLQSRIVTTTNMATSDSKSDGPLVSPVEEDKRCVPVSSTLAFIATLLLATPIFLFTILPLSLLYQAAKAILAPFRTKKEPPQLDSGYEMDPSNIIPRSKRKYDIVVLGATGFTGRLAVRHLAKTYGCDGAKVRWAIAGRSESKLNRVREELASELNMPDEMKKIDCIIVDTTDVSTMPALVQDTRVVATTAGPYNLYGSPVVEFCARFGTHYVDITGEVDWVKAMEVQWNSVARHTGAKLISFCGHDSVPWDLSVMKLQSILKEECDDKLVSATFWDQSVGGVPGGTVATMVNQIQGESIKPPPSDIDAFLRLPDDSESEYVVTPELPLLIAKARSPWDGPSSERWTMPFIMATINAEVVKRSYALRQEGSKTMIYKESFLMPDFKSAFIGFMGFNTLVAAFFNPLTGFLARKLMPAPGEGPAMEDMEKKHYLCVYGEGVGEKGNRVQTIFYVPQDPGCMETSRMLVESGLCMALQDSELPSMAADGGFWTTSTALGDVLMKRLEDVGMRFSSRVVPAKS